MSGKLEKRTLKNGITVLFEKRDLDVVSFSITNRYGGAFEDSKVKGVAHLMEHLVFTGTESRSHEDISREIEKKGGVLNAFTSHEVTSFWFKLPSEHLFAGIDILADMLKNPKFDKEKFEKEKRVVLEEIKMYHDNPMRAVYEQIEKNMFGAPFGELVIGSKESVSGLERDWVAEHFKEVYSPENYIVTVVGNADIGKVCEYFEENFAAENRRPEVKKIEKKNGESSEEREGIDQAHLMFGVHSPLQGDEKHNVLEVLDGYLGNGMSSRLFLEIREKRGLAYAVKSSIDAEKSYSYYAIYVGTTKEAIEDVKKIILEEFDAIEKMTEKDLKEAKERVIGLRKVMSEEGSNVMNELMFAEIVGDAEDYYTHNEKIDAVTLEQVKSLAKELIAGGYSTAAIVPK
tara:strand:+ start:120 stop:1325 length:1206 start_codon:yes stop_codon:yes gene_type:complete